MWVVYDEGGVESCGFRDYFDILSADEADDLVLQWGQRRI